MDSAIEQLRESVGKIKTRNKNLTNGTDIIGILELAQASSTLSHEQIKARIRCLTEEIQHKQDRLSKARSNMADEMDVKNKEMYKKRRVLYSKLCSERRNAVSLLSLTIL